MHLPPVVVIVVGGMVVLFGVFRIFLGFRSDEDEEKARARGGLFGLGRRTHVIVGLIYVALGVILMLGAFGIKPPWMR